MRVKTICLSAIAFLFVVSMHIYAQAGAPEVVSVIQLMATPDKFDGKTITVIGFAELSKESSILYLHFEDYRQGILANGIWLERNDIMTKERDQLNLKYVKVSGVFHAKYDKAGFIREAISDINTCAPWSDPEHPRIERYREILKKNSPPN